MMKETYTNLTIESMIADLGDEDSVIFKAVRDRNSACFHEAMKYDLDETDLRIEFGSAHRLIRMASRRASDAIALYREAMSRINLMEIRVEKEKAAAEVKKNE